MTNKLALAMVCVGLLLGIACGSSSTPKAKSPDGGGVAGVGSVSGAGASGAAATGDAAVATGGSGTSGGAAGSTAGTSGAAGNKADGGGAAGNKADGGSAGSAAGTGAAGSNADAGTPVTCDPGTSSVSKCGTASCPAVKSGAAACTFSCCSGANTCGERVATLGQVSQCRVPPTCDTGVSSVSMCGSESCPAVPGSAAACTVNCCSSGATRHCGTRTAIQGGQVGQCVVPSTCDATIKDVTTCGTGATMATCMAVPAQLAGTCTVTCCDPLNRCGFRSAVKGMTTTCRAFGGGGPGGG